MALELFRKQANFIKTFLVHPCARPWYIWVQTFVPSFIKLLITVNLFDIEDLIRGHGEDIVREKGGRGGKKHTPRIKTQGQPTRADRWSQKGLKTLLVVTSPLEKIGFTWLIFSAVDQFFYDWQTLLELSDFCNSPIESGPLQLSRGPGFVSIVIGFIPVILNIEPQNRAGWPHSTLSANVPEGVYQASFSLKVFGPVGGASNLKIRIRTPGAFGDDVTESEALQLDAGQEGAMSVSHSFWYPLIGGGAVTWEVGGETIPIGIETNGGHFTCQRSG